MKSQFKILSRMCLLSLVLILGSKANAQDREQTIRLKKVGWVEAVYAVEQNRTVVYVYNLRLRSEEHDTFDINVEFQVGGKRVIAPETVSLYLDSRCQRRRLSNHLSLTIIFGERKVDLVPAESILREESEEGTLETSTFFIPFALFRELIKENNVRMLLDNDEFRLSKRVLEQLKNVKKIIED